MPTAKPLPDPAVLRTRDDVRAEYSYNVFGITADYDAGPYLNEAALLDRVLTLEADAALLDWLDAHSQSFPSAIGMDHDTRRGNAGSLRDRIRDAAKAESDVSAAPFTRALREVMFSDGLLHRVTNTGLQYRASDQQWNAVTAIYVVDAETYLGLKADPYEPLAEIRAAVREPLSVLVQRALDVRALGNAHLSDAVTAIIALVRTDGAP